MDDRKETPGDLAVLSVGTRRKAHGTGVDSSIPSACNSGVPSLHKLVNLQRPHHLLELAAKAVRATHGAIALVSAEGDLQEQMTFGMDEETARALWGSGWGGDLIHFLLHQAAPLNVADFRRDLLVLGLPPTLASQPPLAMGPFLGVPLMCHGRCRGALYLARRPGKRPFRQQDLETILPLRTWLEQGNLFEEARLLAQLRLLNQVAQAAAGNLDLPQILSVALRELDRHLPQYTCAVWLLETGRVPSLAETAATDSPAVGDRAALVLSTSSIVSNERAAKLGLAAGIRLALEQTRFAACLRDGQAQYVDLARPDFEGEEAHSPAENPLRPFELQLRQRGASSFFAVPLRGGDQAVGVLQCICTRASGFTNEQIQLLYLVADLLGPAISNCQLYRRLRDAYEELRTTKDQLIRAEKMRALGELAGGMAHDFNNSLCGVLGFLELALNDKSLDPTIAGYLDSARTCTLDAAQTVRRVQSFARWQRNELSIQLVDFNELVRQTLELTRHKWESLAHARGAPVVVELQGEATEWVAGSPAELREVITNLVFNAVDAMPEGGRLAVRTWNSATDLYLAVQDTGIGMAESTRRRLFEPFFTTKGERGNGLGLSVTFGIVQRYGGEILVESELGQGATFTVRLPLHPREAPEPSEGGKIDTLAAFSQISRSGPVHEALPAGSPFTSRLPSNPNHGAEEPSPRTLLAKREGTPRNSLSKSKSLRILVIEDEEKIRRFLAQALTQLGHSPRTVADAHEGLAAFAKEPFDLVFTDLGLPGMSGEEVARTIARDSPATPVVLLTGWSNQLKDEAQSLAGVTHILGKPVTLSTLSSTLAAVCP